MTDLFTKHKEIVADIKSVTEIPPATEQYFEEDEVNCRCNVEWLNERGDFIGFDIEGAEASFLYIYRGNFEENFYAYGDAPNIDKIKKELLKFLNAIST